MPLSPDLQNLIHDMRNFEKLFNIVRIVDPVSKQVMQYESENEIVAADSSCYDYWKNGTFCDNCISCRAINEKDTFVKIEYNKEKMYMVMASPVNLSDKEYTVEMLKDITSTGIVPDLQGKTVDEISNIIKRLNKEVITDELTQLLNRRYLNERMPMDLYNSVTNKTPLSVVMIDVDSFKSINDIYEHSCGDCILQDLGTIIQSSIREKHDWAARYGGDEFIIALPGAGQQAAKRVAESIRGKVNNKSVKYKNQTIHFTVSIGIYTVCSEALTTSQLLSLVDKNLYQAKKAGKNTVFFN